jgi:ubiquinone/menaquinone biosynthesis C-methylase UbiE
MKMTRLEKVFVNRKRKSEGNIKKLESDFKFLDVSKIQKVLELGCGIGFVSSYLAKTYHFKVYGTDYDPEQIQIARQVQPELEHLVFQVEDATHLSFQDSEFDLVISQNVFHHIPDWERAVEEISRVLRTGGVLIWLDLAFPEMIKLLFLPVVKNYGLYTCSDIKTAFTANALLPIVHDRPAHGPFRQEHFVLQRQ